MFWTEAIKLPFTRPKLAARLDYKLSSGSQVFYRFTYDNGSDVNAFGGSNFQPLKSRDNTFGNAGGFRFHPRTVSSTAFASPTTATPTTSWTRSAGSSIFDPAPGVSLNFAGGSGFASGPNPQAPQQTKQDNIEARYDGTRTWGNHTFRFGAAVNKIDNLISADLFGLAPQVGSDTNRASVLFAAGGPFAGGAGNPLNYPVDSITLGNGFSCFSEKSGVRFSLRRLQRHPHAGVCRRHLEILSQSDRDHRSAIRSRYRTQRFRFAGHSMFGSRSFLWKPGALHRQWRSADSFRRNSRLGGRVRQPNLNFAPQFGLAWDPGRAGRTVIRAGIGMYYDNNVFRNLLGDRAARLANGAVQRAGE